MAPSKRSIRDDKSTTSGRTSKEPPMKKTRQLKTSQLPDTSKVQKSIPELPDDVLREIFMRMSTMDRCPLGIVSKRFRSIDLEVGNRSIDGIDVILRKVFDGFHVFVDTSSSVSSLKAISFVTTANGDFMTSTPHITDFLKNASIQYLDIWVDSERDSNSALSISSLFHSLSVDEIRLYLNVSTDLTDFIFSFIPSLARLRQLKKFCLVFKYSPCIQSFCRLREALQHIKKLQEFDFMYQIDGGDGDQLDYHVPLLNEPTASSPLSSCVIDGVTMLHLIRNCDVVILGVVNCTGQDLFDAFQVVSESPLISKDMTIYAPDTAIEDLFRLAIAGGLAIFDLPDRGISDFVSRTTLDVNYDRRTFDDTCTNIRMYKLDSIGVLE